MSYTLLDTTNVQWETVFEVICFYNLFYRLLYGNIAVVASSLQSNSSNGKSRIKRSVRLYLYKRRIYLPYSKLRIDPSLHLTCQVLRFLPKFEIGISKVPKCKFRRLDLILTFRGQIHTKNINRCKNIEQW